MLAAGANVQWLRDDLGMIATSAESHDIAAQCEDTGGVVYVPAPLGIGTPLWDYGARGALFGLTRGSGRAEIVRAVLEGVAHRGARWIATAGATRCAGRGPGSPSSQESISDTAVERSSANPRAASMPTTAAAPPTTAMSRERAGRPVAASATTPSTASATAPMPTHSASIVCSFTVVIAPTPRITSRMPTR